LVFEGKAKLHLEGQLVLLEKGRGLGGVERVTAQLQGYKVIKTFTAVEATSPPAEVHGRDE
jgi:hypothetical protein